MAGSNNSNKLSLSNINNLSKIEFQKIFDNVVECWPNAAISVSDLLPVQNIAQLYDAFEEYLTKLNRTDKESVLRLHPDLAGKMANEGKLTKESTTEQAIAGLNKLTPAQASELSSLNETYLKKFDFPFIICVRETNKIDAIINGIRQRMQNGINEEIDNAIQEVKKICKLRIGEIVQN